MASGSQKLGPFLDRRKIGEIFICTIGAHSEQLLGLQYPAGHACPDWNLLSPNHEQKEEMEECS
jgi:hypothetical protein